MIEALRFRLSEKSARRIEAVSAGIGILALLAGSIGMVAVAGLTYGLTRYLETNQKGK
jgi:hypothetical protein